MWIPIISKYCNHHVIVSNILEILQLSRSILANLETNGALETWLEYIDYYRIYSVYILNYSLALDTLSKSTISREISLVELQLDLLKPIQRLPQLKLFFEKISRKSENPIAAQVLAKVLEVAKYINQAIKDRELFVKWVDLDNRLIGYPGQLCNQFY
jgi:hypothetical protein